MEGMRTREISRFVEELRQGLVVSEDKLRESLEELQDYECWTQYFKLLEGLIDFPKRRQLSHYVFIARAYAFHLEDIQQAAKICSKLMKDLKVSYSDFRDSILCSVINESDFENEAVILQSILPRLRTKEDHIACLERLCLIYEKKKYDELQLNKSYEKIIELDSSNQKALRYFKVVYTQNNQWEKVAQVLTALYHSAKHVSDKFRSAQELAAVYLYQLDQASRAIDIIEKYCADSPLNTFTIHFEAYYRLQNWEGCLRVLRAYVKKVEGSNKAVVYLKIGELEEQLKRTDEAEQSFLKCLEFDPKMLESIENLIELHLDEKRWANVIHYLNILCDLVDDPYLKDRVKEGRGRLQDAIESESQKRN